MLNFLIFVASTVVIILSIKYGFYDTKGFKIYF